MIFLTKFTRKEYFQSKNGKSEHHNWNLHIGISLVTKVQLKLTILIFLTKFTRKEYFQSKNGKCEHHHHWIHRIGISLDTIFQLRLTVLTFWKKFVQKGYFWSKTEKENVTIQFCVFELVYVPNFSLNWQFWFYGQSMPKKRISDQKSKKGTSPLNSAYSN